MTIEIKVPVLPESVQSGVIATWHKKEGEAVKRGENLVDLETDKVVLEIPAPQDGVLQKILKKEGSTVKAEEVLATLDQAAVAAPVQAKVETTAAPLPAAPVSAKAEAATIPSQESNKAAEPGMHLSPSMRRSLSEQGIDLQRYAARANLPQLDLENDLVNVANRTEQRVPMTRLQARMAERLVEAKQTTAMLTTFNEVNMQPVMDIRAKYKDIFEKTHGSKLGLMSFFVKACCEALRRYPKVNSSIDGNDIIYHQYCDIGVAIASDRGLVVPILRNAENMAMAEVEKKIVEFRDKAQSGKLKLEEITGGTFSITNGGVFGSLLSTPLLNPPQSAILGMHKVAERPVVENGQIVIRPIMYIALSYDHRVIDGKDSVLFLRAVKEFLEDPTRLLLEV